MAIQTEPTRIQIPFADSGTKNVIPDTNSTPSASQAASWTDGFPAQCSLPLSAGGIPPARADFNGILNAMTQSERFTQEGGVWAWDATVDYGTNRLVLGSDNVLYWSVAQSGPNVGGAQDPTTDNGTYWQAPYAKTMGLAAKSTALATTEWVKDLAGAIVYVSPSGNDSNDGLTSSTPVKTLAQASIIAKRSPGTQKSFARISLAAGSYSGALINSAGFLLFRMEGDISITGDINIEDNASVFFDGPSYNLTISGNVYVATGSSLLCNASTWTQTGSIDVVRFSSIRITGTASVTNSDSFAIRCSMLSEADFSGNASLTVSNSSLPAFYALGSSSCRFLGNLSVVANGVSGYSAIEIHSSSLEVAGKVTVSGSSSAGCISCIYNSYFFVSGGIDASTTTQNGPALTISFESFAIIRGDCNFDSATNTGRVISLNCGSLLSDLGTDTMKLTARSGGGVLLEVNNGRITASCGIQFISATGISSSRAIYVYNCGVAQFLASSEFSVSGTYTAYVVQSGGCSMLEVATTKSVSGTPTGQRYYADRGGQINVGGAGANRLPGTVAGSVNSGSFGYYY